MYPNQYQNQYQYPNQFGGFQNHIEPPMPTKRNNSSGGGFWLGFIGGIITAILIGVGIEVFRRIKTAKQPAPNPLPSPTKDLPESKTTTVKTIKEEIPTIFEISKPHEKQTFDEFLNFLQTQGFTINDDASDVTGKEVWGDENGTEIHFSNIDFTVKLPSGTAETFTKIEALYTRFNDRLLNFINEDGE